jgi:indoleamine 2,3-dioxygenase
MPDTSTLAAADFDIDVRSGFLPPQPPVSRLEGIEEELWESSLDKARALPLRINGGGAWISEAEKKACREWRRSIREMLVLHPSPQLTSDIRYARRAHLVLSWLAHLYIHSQHSPAKKPAPSPSWFSGWTTPSQDEKDRRDENLGAYSFTVPASISVPWVALSTQLDLPPILTYATTVLWNWDLRDPSLGFTDDNVFITTTFSNTPSEEHFFKTSLLIERKGVAALTLMRRSLDEAFVGDSLARTRISNNLTRLGKVIGDLTKILHDVRLGCDPSIFYWGIRPWFNGGDSAVDQVTGEKGWIYEGVGEFEGKRKVFTGPSAGQSSLIHALDVFLGVDHVKKEEKVGSASERENATFMEKMQFYMPGHHRNFLTHLKNISFVEGSQQRNAGGAAEDEEEEDGRVVERHPLRALMKLDGGESAPSAASIEALRASYNGVLVSLKHLRDEHMRIATFYIISQMKTSPPQEYARLNDDLVVRSNKDVAGDSNREERGAKGTGGTDVVSFLKECRKNTVAALQR